MVEERASLFQRFSMVVDALESKAGDEALVAERVLAMDENCRLLGGLLGFDAPHERSLQ
ncbi:MAG: hypothetical protein HKN43_07670 [Rhodothermales bacterium]|nr:hypothetical protein [Rhodothermales bacterium]